MYNNIEKFYLWTLHDMPDNKNQGVEANNHNETPKRRSFFGGEINEKTKDLLDFRYNTQEEIDKLNDEMTTTTDLDEMIRQTNNINGLENNKEVENINKEDEEHKKDEEHKEDEDYLRQKDEQDAEFGLEKDLQGIDNLSNNDGINDNYDEVYKEKEEPIEGEVVENPHKNEEKIDDEEIVKNETMEEKRENESNDNIDIDEDTTEQSTEENKKEEIIEEEIIEEESKPKEDKTQEENQQYTEEEQKDEESQLENGAKFFDPFELNLDTDDETPEGKNQNFDPFLLEENSGDEEENEEENEEEENNKEESEHKEDEEIIEEGLEENSGDEEEKKEDDENFEDEIEDEEITKQEEIDTQDIDFEKDEIDDNKQEEETEEEIDEEEFKDKIENEETENESEYKEPENIENEEIIEEDEINNNEGDEDLEIKDNKQEEPEEDLNEEEEYNEEQFEQKEDEEINEEETEQNTYEEEEMEEDDDDEIVINTPISVNPNDKNEKEEMPKNKKIKKNSATGEIITDDEIQLEQGQDTSISEDDEEYQPSEEELFEQEPEFFANDELSQQFLHLVQNVRGIFKLEHKDGEQTPYFKILGGKTDYSTLEYLFYLIEEKDEPIDLYIKKVETDQETGEENEHLVQFSYNEDKELNIFVDEVILYERINKAEADSPEYNDTKAILEKFIFLTDNHYDKLKAEINKEREERQKKKQLQQIFKGF